MSSCADSSECLQDSATISQYFIFHFPSWRVTQHAVTDALMRAALNPSPSSLKINRNYLAAGSFTSPWETAEQCCARGKNRAPGFARRPPRLSEPENSPALLTPEQSNATSRRGRSRGRDRRPWRGVELFLSRGALIKVGGGESVFTHSAGKPATNYFVELHENNSVKTFNCFGVNNRQPQSTAKWIAMFQQRNQMVI